MTDLSLDTTENKNPPLMEGAREGGSANILRILETFGHLLLISPFKGEKLISDTA